ncbi:unnamed protein product [Linum tenue]|uniref:Uncharacterized protein n=1 Tax=Linum tenue TaxID=586396 RepID=A0AAV0R4V9_9ROSI|nr:unnamed protein product [Linum tenue]
MYDSLTGMDQNFPNVLTAEDVVYPEKEAMDLQQTMPDSISEADEVYTIYDPDSPLLTPDTKLGGNKVHHQVASASPGGGANSSDLSLKDGSESSVSQSDSDSESSNSSNAYYSLPLNTGRKGMSYQLGNDEKVEIVVAGENNATYEELLRKVSMYEGELKLSNLRLQKSEEEVSWLKNELRKGAESMQSQLLSAQREIKAREGDLEVERRRVVELENRIAEGASELLHQLELAREEIAALKESNLSYRDQLSDQDEEAKELKAAMLCVEVKFHAERSELQSCISTMSEQQTLMEASIKACEAEKMEMKASFDAQAIQFGAEISQLKAELASRGEELEGLNKNFDTFKHKYDMVVVEKDKLIAKVNTMNAELRCQDEQRREVEEHLKRLNLENGDLIADCESGRKLAEELRMRVVELEKEVDRQKGELLAGAEEKREAIRQLCFSLEHYRSGYKELREAFVGQKRLRVVA